MKRVGKIRVTSKNGVTRIQVFSRAARGRSALAKVVEVNDEDLDALLVDTVKMAELVKL